MLLVGIIAKANLKLTIANNVIIKAIRELRVLKFSNIHLSSSHQSGNDTKKEYQTELKDNSIKSL